MHNGNSLSGLPIYAPADAAIPVAGRARAALVRVRPFVSDHQLMQREAKTNDAGVTYGAYGVIGFFTLLLLAMLAWGLHRIRVTASRGGDERTRREPQSPAGARHPVRRLRGSS